MIPVVIDYETSWGTWVRAPHLSPEPVELTLSKMSAAQYVLHPDFRVHGAAVKIADNASVWITGSELQAFLDALPWEQIVLIGQNSARFDNLITRWIYGHAPAIWCDTIDMAKAVLGSLVRSYSLESLCSHYGREAKQKKKNFWLTKGKATLTKQEEAELAEYALDDADDTKFLFDKLVPEFPAGQWHIMHWCARMMVETQLRLDRKLLMHVHQEEVARKEKLVAEIGLTMATINSNAKFAKVLGELLEPYGEAVPMKLSARTGKETYAFAKNDEEFVDMADHPDERIAALVQTRLATKGGLLETRALSYAQTAVATNGWAPVGLNYCGALATGRLSGNSAGIANAQNLGRGSQLRAGIRAPKGYKIVAADLSQIELRIGALAVGQTDIVEKLRNGEDTYSWFAAYIYEREILKERDKEERLIGKVATLSCQYQTSPPTFRRMLMAQAKLRVDMKFAAHVVNTYRTTLPMYPEAWKSAKLMLAQWAKDDHDPALWFPGVPATVAVERGRITFPSGAALKYPRLRQEQVWNKFQEKHVWAYTMASQARGKCFTSELDDTKIEVVAGHRILENFCQAAAAEIINDKAVTLGLNYDLWPAMQVHDELVFCVPDSDVDDAKSVINATLCEELRWWPELPVACEIHVGQTYLEAK